MLCLVCSHFSVTSEVQRRSARFHPDNAGPGSPRFVNRSPSNLQGSSKGPIGPIPLRSGDVKLAKKIDSEFGQESSGGSGRSEDRISGRSPCFCYDLNTGFLSSYLCFFIYFGFYSLPFKKCSKCLSISGSRWRWLVVRSDHVVQTFLQSKLKSAWIKFYSMY